MNADIQPLFYSPLVGVFDFKCRETAGSISKPEWRSSFNINFIRKGNFGYKIAKDFYDIHSGVILLENANTECIVSHDHHVKDECMSLCIQESLLREMSQAYSLVRYSGNFNESSANSFNFQSIVIRSTPEIESIHALLYRSSFGNLAGESLKLDLLIVALLQQIFAYFAKAKQIDLPVQLDKKSKDLHLETIDRAKNYILNNFKNEMSLSEIARNAYVSPFHFSRLFKYFTSLSPYQYLLTVRLTHAVLLLKNTCLSITEICFESGFNSFEHFIATFTNRYRISPLKFRHHHS